MFCDLVGSTALAARFDPEDMRSIIGAYHKCCANLVERGGRFVAKYGRRGARLFRLSAGARARRRTRGQHRARDRRGCAETRNRSRLGAACAGRHRNWGRGRRRLLGSAESQERGVVGDTPNLAARLQGIASPASVIIAESTRKQLGELFELADLGPQDLKGVAGLTRAYAALRQSSQESRFEALHTGGLTALVGREEEIELLLRRWAKAKAGDGQVTLLSARWASASHG